MRSDVIFWVSMGKHYHERVTQVNSNAINLCITFVIMKTLAERLTWARTEKGMSQQQVADQAGVAQSTIGSLESGARRTARKIASIAATLGVDPLWLAEGKGAPRTILATEKFDPATFVPPSDIPKEELERILRSMGAKKIVMIEEDDEAFVRIPLIEMRLQAGVPGFQADEEYEASQQMHLPRAWLDQKGLRQAALVAMRVKGDSMYPSLSEGDTVVVNTSDRKMVDGAVFAVNYEGKAVIKRLEREAGTWYLSSDNNLPEFRRRAIRDNETIIVGRVVRKESDRI